MDCGKRCRATTLHVFVVALSMAWTSPLWASDCAIDSLGVLSSVLAEPGRSSAAELALVGQPPYSLLDVKRAAANIGIVMEGRSCTLEEAVNDAAPVVLALRDPDHFLVALNQEPGSLQMADGQRIVVMDRQTLQARFKGVALFVLPDDGADAPLAIAMDGHFDAGDLPPLTVPLTVSWIRCLQPCP